MGMAEEKCFHHPKYDNLMCSTNDGEFFYCECCSTPQHEVKECLSRSFKPLKQMISNHTHPIEDQKKNGHALNDQSTTNGNTLREILDDCLSEKQEFACFTDRLNQENTTCGCAESRDLILSDNSAKTYTFKKGDIWTRSIFDTPTDHTRRRLDSIFANQFFCVLFCFLMMSIIFFSIGALYSNFHPIIKQIYDKKKKSVKYSALASTTSDLSDQKEE